MHLLQVRASDWNGGSDEDMDCPPELPDGKIVDRDDIITENARRSCLVRRFCHLFAMSRISMERGGKMTYVCPQVKTQTMTEEDAREDSIALVQRRTNRLHWNSAMRRRYYQHG